MGLEWEDSLVPGFVHRHINGLLAAVWAKQSLGLGLVLLSPGEVDIGWHFLRRRGRRGRRWCCYFAHYCS